LDTLGKWEGKDDIDESEELNSDDDESESDDSEDETIPA
jgi:hypothetical protein